jgi:hypothetical protein
VGFQGFSSLVSPQTYYGITSRNDWEVGIGTYESGLLFRDSVFDSSNGGNLISLTGTSTVFVTYPADKAVYLSPSGMPSFNDLLFRGETSWESRPLNSGDIVEALGYTPPSSVPSYTAESGVVLSGTKFQIGGTGSLNQLFVNSSSSTAKGIVVKSAVSQTANLIEAQDSSEKSVFSVSPLGLASGVSASFSSGIQVGSGIPLVKDNKIYASGYNLFWGSENILGKSIISASGNYMMNPGDDTVLISSGIVYVYKAINANQSSYGKRHTIKAMTDNCQIAQIIVISPFLPQIPLDPIDGSENPIQMKKNDCMTLVPYSGGWIITSRYSSTVDGNLQ